MKALSTSEEQVMAALWACGKPATRRQIAAKLPPDCVWADSTLLNFLLRLEAKGYVRPEKEGNKNIYTPLVRRVTYCGAVSAAHLQTLYGGDLRSMVAALSDTGRITNAEIERLARWLATRVAESPKYDYDRPQKRKTAPCFYRAVQYNTDRCLTCNRMRGEIRHDKIG